MTHVCTLLYVLCVSSIAVAQEAAPTIAEVPPARTLVPLPVDPSVIDQSLAFEPVSAGSLAPSSEIQKEIDEAAEAIVKIAEAKVKDKEAFDIAEKEETALLMTKSIVSGLEEDKKISFLAKLYASWQLSDEDDVLVELDKRIAAATERRETLAKALACHDEVYKAKKGTVDKLKINLAIATKREKEEDLYALPETVKALQEEVASLKARADANTADIGTLKQESAANMFAIAEVKKELAKQSEIVMLLAAMQLNHDERTARDELLAKARDYLESHKGDPKAAKKVTETLEKAAAIFEKSKKAAARPPINHLPSHAVSAPQQCGGRRCTVRWVWPTSG